jgi:nitrate reductase molybdenum cofactor assembly chaperone NarJ/NarW
MGWDMRRKTEALFPFFAEILEYPTRSLHETFDEFICLLWCLDRESARMLRDFDFLLGREPLARLEEIYTDTFDLRPACYPYVGHHLFGEDNRRGEFMAGLKKRFLACGFSAGPELPDNLAVILKFLPRCPGGEEKDELVREGLVPALDRMISGFPESGNPYLGVLRALRRVLDFKP